MFWGSGIGAILIAICVQTYETVSQSVYTYLNVSKNLYNVHIDIFTELSTLAKVNTLL